MNVLGQEAEALHEADYRRARLLQRLQQFQELQTSLTEVRLPPLPLPLFPSTGLTLCPADPDHAYAGG
jgi:hypothetical protein